MPLDGLRSDLCLSLSILHVTVYVFFNFLPFVYDSKSLIKLTKTRIDVIRRKRNATQKFLKKDIADLLVNGLDINAFGRVILLVSFSSSFDSLNLPIFQFNDFSCEFDFSPGKF